MQVSLWEALTIQAEGFVFHPTVDREFLKIFEQEMTWLNLFLKKIILAGMWSMEGREERPGSSYNIQVRGGEGLNSYSYVYFLYIYQSDWKGDRSKSCADTTERIQQLNEYVDEKDCSRAIDRNKYI